MHKHTGHSISSGNLLQHGGIVLSGMHVQLRPNTNESECHLTGAAAFNATPSISTHLVMDMHIAEPVTAGAACDCHVSCLLGMKVASDFEGCQVAIKHLMQCKCVTTCNQPSGGRLHG